MLRLKTLHAKGCRGIFDGPELSFGHGGLLLCGHNGTGKSSYIDAIEKVLTGRCSSLDTGDQGLSWKTQGTHVLSKAAKVELTLTDGTSDAVLNLDTDTATLKNRYRVFVEAASRQSFILRRRTMLRFIDAKDAGRYQALEAFLNVRAYTDFEGKIAQLVKLAERSLAEAHDNERRVVAALHTHVGNAIPEVTAESCYRACDEGLAAAGLSPVRSAGELEVRQTEIRTLLAPFGDMNALAAVQRLSEKVEAIPPAADTEAALAKVVNSAAAFVEERERLRGQFFAAVLEQGFTWIEQDQLDRCPLCDSTIDVEQVREFVGRRLAENQTLTRLDEEWQSAARAWDQWRKATGGAWREVASAWIAVTGSDFPAEAALIPAFLSAAAEPDGASASKERAEGWRATWLGLNQDTHVAALAAALQAKRASIPTPGERHTALYESFTRLVALTADLPRLEVARNEVARLTAVSVQVKRIADHAERARKSAVQKLLNEVAVEADRYYQQIHPGESIGDVVLKMTDRGAGSVAMSSGFHGKTGDPRGYYSEGHVDSLGLCLFLALRRLHHRENPELALLILDDVLHSVDADHRSATAKLIFDEFKDHQIIVTTHDPLWFENLKVAARGVKCKQVRIAQWTVERGPEWGDHLSDYEWLISPLAAGAKPADQVIKAGRLLEEMLQNLCHGLKIAVTFDKTGRYTVDPLWSAFSGGLPQKNPAFFEVAKAHVAEIEARRAYRNWVGAHWNEWAAGLTPAEARQFKDAVLGLRAASYCDNCARFVSRIGGLKDVWSCECEKQRYSKSTGA